MDLNEIVNNSFTQIGAAVMGLWGAWKLYKKDAVSDARSSADTQGQLEALESWKNLLAGQQQLYANEREARLLAEARADKFADERNKANDERSQANTELYKMQGQMTALNETLLAQTKEITSLRQQVQALQEQIKNAGI